MAGLLEKIRDSFLAEIWQREEETMAPVRRFVTRTTRMLHVLGRDLAEGQLTLRAMSLVYTTLLSLVPLMAFMFAVLKGFGVHNRLEPLLFQWLEPLGPRGQDVGRNIIAFVDNVKAGVLGSVGLAMLLYTVITLIQKIESGFNYVWHVNRPRTLARRFTDYLSVIMVGPLMVVTALGLTATISSHKAVHHILDMAAAGPLLVLAAKVLPYLLVVGTFTFVYMFVPNTRVRFRSALVGGVAAGVLWEAGGALFAWFTASSSQYTAIYSGFAILLVFMIWLYYSWMILLLGAEIAFYYQHPEFINLAHARYVPSNRLRERMALTIMQLVGARFREQGRAWTLETLSRRLRIPMGMLSELVEQLVGADLLLVTAGEVPGYVPARDMHHITLYDILYAIRRFDRSAGDVDRQARATPVVDELIADIEASQQRSLDDRTLADLVEQASTKTG